ncbi:aminotransferase class V-fold PLP-dependent enzyme [Acetonema longum]|uniref:cysteine desulfurase n=1 Tax=Acetonema longum DSM 6540 TaxID=1009370 RepID=F7NIG3_9FIRM|nr:aminotransferase class V-fold PLP-dependent enzyme [Acetonema longum]EGO64193.1 selenocysteine lyase [Acetonema longum DSM 6540]
MIYLDNAATTWPKPEAVYQAVDHCLRYVAGSPGRGGHSGAWEAGRILMEAREELAALFGIGESTQIGFCYNATDALNTALLGFLQPGDRVLATAMEHNAVARPLRYLADKGVQVEVLSCDQTGQLSLEGLRQALRRKTSAVVVCHGSNVTGAVQPLAEIGGLTRQAGAAFIVDAAQTGGVEPIQVQAMGIDLLAFSGHKGLLGPQGIAGLYVRPGTKLIPLRYGGTGSLSESDLQPDFMPDMLESGTSNTPGIAGLKAGVEFIRRTGLETIRDWEMKLTGQLMDGLSQLPGVVIHGPRGLTGRTAVVSVTASGWDSAGLARRLSSDYGIACRGGLHCAHWAHRRMGTQTSGLVRFSPGFFNTEQDIQKTIDAMKSILGEE